MDLVKLSSHLKRHIRPGVPQYVSLKDAFVEAIAMGTVQTGDKVPNEQELAATLPMSLGTIQRALRDLATSGVLDRKARAALVRAGLARRKRDGASLPLTLPG